MWIDYPQWPCADRRAVTSDRRRGLGHGLIRLDYLLRMTVLTVVIVGRCRLARLDIRRESQGIVCRRWAGAIIALARERRAVPGIGGRRRFRLARPAAPLFVGGDRAVSHAAAFSLRKSFQSP